MFCQKCQQFWKAVAAGSNIPVVIESKSNVRWGRHETVLHRNFRELTQSSRANCTICRAIEFTPSVHERDAFLSDHDELLDVVLSFEFDPGAQPMLYAGFWEANQIGKKARISKRLIAGFAGLITDG